MCSRFDPLRDARKLSEYFAAAGDIPPDLPPMTYPTYMAPFIRKHPYADVGDEAVPARELMVGMFGLVPYWAKDADYGRGKFNARSETAHQLNTFRGAWKEKRHCIIPVDAFYEPDWRTGKNIWTRFTRLDGKPMGIAGLWEHWKDPKTLSVMHSFTMLTINADDHPLMKNYHRPGDEKRMIVVLDEDEYDDWLEAPPEECRQYLDQYPADRLAAEPTV